MRENDDYKKECLPHAPLTAKLHELHHPNNVAATHRQVRDATHYLPTTYSVVLALIPKDFQQTNQLKSRGLT